MRKIPLTQNKFALVDDEDVHLIEDHKWFAHKGSSTYYATTWIVENGTRKLLGMHSIVMGYNKIDHINHNGLDNRKINLRPCISSQNSANRRKHKNTICQFKGVYKAGNYWRARVTKNGRAYNVGYFDSEKGAALAYDRKAEELFGEFACLNFPMKKNTPIPRTRQSPRRPIKLSLQQVVIIKKLLLQNIAIQYIAKQFNVSVKTICDIKSGKRWGNA